MKKPFLWWRNHSYDEETILMMKKQLYMMKKPVYAESYCEEISMKLEKSRYGNRGTINKSKTKTRFWFFVFVWPTLLFPRYSFLIKKVHYTHLFSGIFFSKKIIIILMLTVKFYWAGQMQRRLTIYCESGFVFFGHDVSGTECLRKQQVCLRTWVVFSTEE